MSSAWAKFTRPVVPKMSDSPIEAIAKYKPSFKPSSVSWLTRRTEKLLSETSITVSAVTSGKIIRWSAFSLTLTTRLARVGSFSATPSGNVAVFSVMEYSPGLETGIRKLPSLSVVAPPTSSMDSSTPSINTFAPVASVYCRVPMTPRSSCTASTRATLWPAPPTSPKPAPRVKPKTRRALQRDFDIVIVCHNPEPGPSGHGR